MFHLFPRNDYFHDYCKNPNLLPNVFSFFFITFAPKYKFFYHMEFSVQDSNCKTALFTYAKIFVWIFKFCNPEKAECDIYHVWICRNITNVICEFPKRWHMSYRLLEISPFRSHGSTMLSPVEMTMVQSFHFLQSKWRRFGRGAAKDAILWSIWRLIWLLKSWRYW